MKRWQTLPGMEGWGLPRGTPFSSSSQLLWSTCQQGPQEAPGGWVSWGHPSLCGQERGEEGGGRACCILRRVPRVPAAGSSWAGTLRSVTASDGRERSQSPLLWLGKARGSASTGSLYLAQAALSDLMPLSNALGCPSVFGYFSGQQTHYRAVVPSLDAQFESFRYVLCIFYPLVLSSAPQRHGKQWVGMGTSCT